MTKTDGGPAFACMAVGPSGDQYGEWGMSLRDWFAGQPNITGSLSAVGKETCEELCGPAPKATDLIALYLWQVKVLATLRYLAADAMIAARQENRDE